GWHRNSQRSQPSCSCASRSSTRADGTSEEAHPLVRHSSQALFDERLVSRTEWARVALRGQERRHRRQPGQRAIAAPSPIARVLAQTGAHGIQLDVAACLEHVQLVLDEPLPIWTGKNMPAQSVLVVEVLRIQLMQPLHSMRKGIELSAKHTVIVIRHQAIREAAPVFTHDDAPEKGEEECAIVFVFEDRLAAVAALRDMNKHPASVRKRMCRNHRES